MADANRVWAIAAQKSIESIIRAALKAVGNDTGAKRAVLAGAMAAVDSFGAEPTPTMIAAGKQVVDDHGYGMTDGATVAHNVWNAMRAARFKDPA